MIKKPPTVGAYSKLATRKPQDGPLTSKSGHDGMPFPAPPGRGKSAVMDMLESSDFFNHTPPQFTPSSYEFLGPKRIRSGSFSSRLRSASDAEDLGLIDRAQRDALSNVILAGDEAVLAALDKFADGEPSGLEELIRGNVLTDHPTLDAIVDEIDFGIQLADGGAMEGGSDDHGAFPFDFDELSTMDHDGGHHQDGSSTSSSSSSTIMALAPSSDGVPMSTILVKAEKGETVDFEFDFEFGAGFDVEEDDEGAEKGDDCILDDFLTAALHEGLAADEHQIWHAHLVNNVTTTMGKPGTMTTTATNGKTFEGKVTFPAKLLVKAEPGTAASLMPSTQKKTASIEIPKNLAGTTTNPSSRAPSTCTNSSTVPKSQPRAITKPNLGVSTRSAAAASAEASKQQHHQQLEQDEDGMVLKSSSTTTPIPVGKAPNAVDGGKHMIGAYSPESRKARIERFLEKKKKRIWHRKVKYDVRKNFADSRIRVKGRFVKKEDEAILIESVLGEEVPPISEGSLVPAGSESTPSTTAAAAPPTSQLEPAGQLLPNPSSPLKVVGVTHPSLPPIPPSVQQPQTLASVPTTT